MNIVSDIPIERINKRVHVLFNSLFFAFEQIEYRYNSLYTLFLKGKDENNSLGVSLAWDIVDWSEKLRKLLGYGAGIKKKNDWYTTIIEHLNKMEEVRHLIQHFDRTISQKLDEGAPPLGCVSALLPKPGGKSFNCKIMNTGSFFLEKGEWFKVGGFTMPTSIKGPIDHITLSLSDMSVNLTELVDEILKSKQAFSEYIQSTYIDQT